MTTDAITYVALASIGSALGCTIAEFIVIPYLKRKIKP